MRKTTILGKVIGAVLAFAILFSMAVPAFAASTNHAKASFEIVSCEPYASISNYMKITYRVVMSCKDLACLRSATVKVDGKSIYSGSFQKNSDGNYVYEGVAYKFNTPTNVLTLEVIDLRVQMSSGKQTETIYVKDIVNTYPKVYVSSIGTGLGILGSTVISLSTIDNDGIKSVSVNGKVIANELKTEGKKNFSMIYDIYADGLYSVVVTDVSGNKTTAYFTVENGEITTQSTGSYPVGGDLNTYIPFYYYFGYSSLAEMMEENPMLYYYYLYQNYDGDISTLYPSLNYPSWNYPSINYPSVNYPSISLPNFGTDDNTSYLWYLYMNGMLDSELFDTDDPTVYYYLMMMLQGKGENTEISDYLSKMFLYQYIYGNAITFTDGNKLTATKSGDSLTLTAPAIANDKNANYQWQKLVGGKWCNIAGATDKEYVLDDAENGDRYRVTISGNYYYSVLTSSVYVHGKTEITAKPEDTTTPIVPPVTDEETKEFTSDDIKIKGLNFPMFALKVGQSADLVPNCVGYWTINGNVVSASSNFGAINVSGVKAGTAVLTFIGFDGNGNMATKVLYAQVTE